MEARRLSSTHRAVCGAFVLVVLACAVLAPVCAAAPQGKYVRVETIGEMLRVWRPETHLYVLGTVPLEEDVLAELAGWLDGKHWTVLLVEDATGQSYTDIHGVLHTGVDAVEWGVGEGMLRRPGFAKQLHPRTGEPDGAVFAIVLAQRALYYTSSAAQKSRGLGEFGAGLDQWAIQAMREGNNVVAAVTATVSNIDSRVEAAIQQEEFTARQKLDEANAGLATYEARARELTARLPQALPNLDLPDAETLRTAIAAGEPLLEEGRYRQAGVELSSVIARQRAATQTIAGFLGVGQGLDLAEQRLNGLEQRAGAAGAQRELDDARRGIAGARELYLRAAPGYAEALQSLDGTLSAAETAIARSERDLARAEWLAAVKRGTLRTLPSAIGFLLLCIGLVLIGRRRPAKVEALSLLAAWRTALDRKLAAVYDELEARVARFVGPASGEGRRSWEGESRQLADEIRTDVGSLTILWTSANSVLQQAEALIRARGFGAVFNLFFPHKYRRGTALLRDEPVPFDPAEGLPQLFGEDRSWRDDLLGDLGSYEPFQKSLQEIVDELNLRAGRAADALDRFERAVVEGPPALEDVAARLERLSGLETEISFGGTDDGLFLVPAAFAVASPAAAATLARAREKLRHDPVAAFHGEIAEAGRIVGETLALAELALAARRDTLPPIAEGLGALQRARVATAWIEAERSALSQRAEELARQAVGESVRPGLEELGRSLTDLRGRVERAAAHTETLAGTTRAEIERVTSLVEVGRYELGDVLGLPPDRLLREADADPSVRLAAATEQAERAHQALGRGVLAEAETALVEAARFSAEAEEIVEASCQAHADHAKVLAAGRAETQRLEEQVPSNERTLGEIQESFAPSVLFLGSGSGTHASGNWTLADNVEEALGQLGLAWEKAERADEVFRAGELLAAARLLGEVGGHQEQAGQQLAEVAERKERLDLAVLSNRSLLEALDLRVREGRLSIVGDPRTMEPTVAAFEAAAIQVEEGRRRVEEVPGDPLMAELKLFAARDALEDVERHRAPADRLLFTEAQASVEAAVRQLEAAAHATRRAAEDRVPDSMAIRQATEGVNALLADQIRLREALRVEHGDWQAADVDADRIAAEAAQFAATLTGEAEAAQRASAAITSAAGRVREAKGLGPLLADGAGGLSLANARRLLEAGDYAAAAQEAATAQSEASQAIAAAAAAAAEAERQRREAWQRSQDTRRSSTFGTSVSSSFGGSRSSSSGSSRSSFSSGSGSSRSSFRSGSGSSKSGW